MILTDKMKDLKIYKTKSYLPYDLKNKKNNSAIYLLSPNFQSSKKLMENQMFINNNRFQSYYLERDVSYYIGGPKVEDIEESTILYEEYIEETKRSELPDDAFGVPSKRKFPLDTEKHVRSAIKFFNYVDPEDEAELARRIIAAMKKFNITDVKVGKNNRFSKYYHPKESTNESVVSKLDNNFESKYKLSLSEFNKKAITPELIESNKANNPILKHIKTNCKGWYYTDKDNNFAAIIAYEEKSNDEIWLQALEIAKEYQGHGLSRPLLDQACKDGVKYLSVNKKNEVAISIYKKYGFKVYDETDTMYFMSLNKDNAIGESMLFNEKNLELNLDKWSTNQPLYITGISGSGKTTLGRKLAKENDAVLISSDAIVYTYGKTKEDLNIDNINIEKTFCDKESLVAAKKFIDATNPKIPGKGSNEEDFDKYIMDFLYWLNNYKIPGKKLIVEGSDIILLDISFVKQVPLIVINNSYLTSILNRIKRNMENDIGLFEAIQRQIKNNKKMYGFYKEKERFLKKLKDSTNESYIEERVDEKLDIDPEIIAFNKELNSWKYGVLINGKVYTKADKIDWSKYRTIPTELMAKYHVGVCWDFVNYEYKWFKERGIKTEAFMFVMQLSDDVDDIVTHTFLLFNEKGSKYWFESSWFGHQHIVKVSGYKDVIKELVERYGNHSYSVYKYSPEGLDKNLTNSEFFKRTTRNLVFNYEAKNESYIEEANTNLYKRIIDNPTMIKSVGFISNDNIYNENVYIKEYNKPLRGRSELLVIKDNKVLLNKKSNGGYAIPGGGWEDKEDHNLSAKREAEEECRVKVKNISYCGCYAAIFPPKDWVKEKISKENWWYGEYCEVYCATYDGKFKGFINKIDKDENMELNSKFYDIDSVYKSLIPQHQKAIDKYRNDILKEDDTMSASRFLSYLPESTFNMGDKVLFFNEDVNDTKLRKLLFSSRIKNRKELLNILEDVKKECPWIKYIYPDIKRYGNKNLFIDLYYYNSIFFQNNDWVNKKGLNLYSEFMWRLLNKSSITNYTKKTIFIPILDWDKYHDASVWNYRVNINPMSCIYQMMFMGQLHYLKKAFSTNDVIFIANDKYFKINFSTIDTKDLKRLAIKFRLFLIKICKNEEFDPIDIDTTSDNAESPEVIRAKLIDKVEDNTGIDITKQVADSVEKTNAIKKAANRKDIIGITNLEKEKFATKQSIENKKTIIDKQLAKQKELINSTKSKLAKAETDTTTDDITEKRKKDLADKITKASEDYDNEEDAMDELDDEETERLLISLKGGDDRIKITPARSKRMAQLDEDVLNKEINGRKVKDILEDNSDKKEEITTVDVATPNDEWNELKFMNFDKNYNIEKDLIQIFRHFATCSMPLVIRNLKVSDSSTSEDRTMLYDVDYEDYMGKRYNIKLDIPVMEDNRFLLRGNYKSIQTQFFNMPIIKTEIDTCQLISNYNKIFLYRFGSTAGKSSPIVARIIKASNKYKGTKIKFESGYNLKVSNKYQLPIDYIDLSMVYASITTSRYIIYFNQDIIREKYVIEEDKGIPYAYDKKENAILYFDPSYRPFDEILYDILADGDANFVDLFESATRPNVGAYTRASIMSSKIPLAIILGYYVGLRETLTRANIKYKITDKLTKEIRQDMHKDWIRFEDGYVVYDADYNSNLLLNGLKACSTSIYKLSDMDNKAMYLDFLDDFGGRRKADGLDNFRDLFVDPMIRESLEYYNFPTDFIDILIYGSMLLADNKYMKHTNTASRRLRRYQLIAAYTYKVMSGAYNEYSIHKHNPNNANFSVKRSAVIDLFLTDNITSDDSCINALRDIETTNAITTKGPSGMNSDRAYSLDKRAYDESMINVLGMSTGFAGNVGITRQTTIDANVTPDGYVMNNEGETENMNDANTLTATEALTPFGSTHDDPMRTAMTFIQTSKHSVRTEDGDPLLVTNGIDEVIPYMTTNKFAYKAKMDGKILEINDRYILIEYKDGTRDIINLQETIEKNSDGGYYVPMKLDASKGLRKGTQIKKDQILAYDKLSFSNSLGESDNLAYNIGKLAKVAIINSDEGFEDSGIISNSMAKKLATRIDVQYECVINKDAKIFFAAKVGDHIEASQPLIIWEDAFDDEDTQDLINSLSSSTISDIGKRKLNSEVTGELKGIKIFRTVELDDLSESVRQFVEDYEAPIKEFAKVVEENGISKSKVPATYTLPPTGKLKKSQEAIYVEFYVEYLDTVGVGDKVVYMSANKAVEKSIFPEGKEPYTEFRPNEIIDAMVSVTSINHRIVTSSVMIGAINKLLIELDRSVKDIMGIDYDDSTI